MYAVALDLRVFANNVSSIFITIVLKPRLGNCLLLIFMSFFPKVLWNELGWDISSIKSKKTGDVLTHCSFWVDMNRFK